MSASLDWSYQSLCGPDRLLLRRLAIFTDDFAVVCIVAADEIAASDVLVLGQYSSMGRSRLRVALARLCAAIFPGSPANYTKKADPTRRPSTVEHPISDAGLFRDAAKHLEGPTSTDISSRRHPRAVSTLAAVDRFLGG